MLFRGPLPLKLNWDLQQWIRLCLIIRMNLHFFINVLMCTAYTNLANTFIISFLSKNSDLLSMLEA